jgi:hypothetical protein
VIDTSHRSLAQYSLFFGWQKQKICNSQKPFFSQAHFQVIFNMVFNRKNKLTSILRQYYTFTIEIIPGIDA